MFIVFTMYCKGRIGFESSKKTEIDETMIVGFVFNRNWKSMPAIQQKLLHIKIFAYTEKRSAQHFWEYCKHFYNCTQVSTKKAPYTHLSICDRGIIWKWINSKVPI